MGGNVKDPSYKRVCMGDTGHAEVVHLTYDSAMTKYEDLLSIFWRIHDPTTLNRQKFDVGEQYKSAIFYHDEEQEGLAKAAALEEQGRLCRKVVTQIVPAQNFYPAEEYHQQYIRKTGQGSCHL